MRSFVKALLVSFVFVSTQALAADLTGMWTAKRRFGPDAQGTLIIQRSGAAYRADFEGRVIPISSAHRELSFALPGAQGAFRGKLDANGVIHGLWLRPGTPVFGGGRTTPVGASPVTLQADGANRWRGAIEPANSTFTFYLLVRKQPDGSFGAVLRNPEFDLGTQQGVERITLEGDVVKLIGKRRGKEQEVASGTYYADDQTMTLRFPTRGGTYDFTRDGDANGFYPRGNPPEHYVYRAPVARDDGWPVGTLEAANIDRASMEKLVQRFIDMPMDSSDAPQIHSLTIARHGKLVLEEYFHEYDRDKPHNMRSASKSLTSVTVGAAMQAGVPIQLSSHVYEVMNDGHFPEGLDPQKRSMTLENLLTMSAGFFCDDTNDDAPGNEDKMWDQTEEPSFYRFTLAVPQATPPGENSVYCSAMPNLALGMVGRAAHESPMTLFERLVARPMKMRHYVWGLDPAGNPYGGGGMDLLPRDFMKLGQLILNGGTWEGHRIVSREFAARSGSPIYHLRNIGYGYLWWSEDYPYKNRTVHTFSARGAGGQTTTVIPELDLVVTTTGGSFSSRKGAFAASTDMIPTLILPAVREPGDDPHAPVIEREYVSPYGPSKDGSRIRKAGG